MLDAERLNYLGANVVSICLFALLTFQDRCHVIPEHLKTS